MLAETEHQLRNILLEKFEYDENKILHLYETDYRPRSYHPGRAVIETTYISRNTENAARIAENIRQAIASGEDVKETAEKFNAEFFPQGINLIRLPAMNLPLVMHEPALTLPQGEVSKVIEDEHYFWVVKCLEREDAKYQDYESTKPMILHHLLRVEYEEQIKTRIKGAYKTNPDVYDLINEQFIRQNAID